MPGLGVLPFFAAARELPAEDAMGLDNYAAGAAGPGRPIRIVVPLLPRIANFDDLDPLRAEPDVALDLLRPGQALPMQPSCLVTFEEPAAARHSRQPSPTQASGSVA